MVEGIALWIVYLAAWISLRGAVNRLPRPSAWSVGLWAAVAVPSVAQALAPVLLEMGRRDPAAIGRGEWWRLVTSAFLQDGGVAGTLFNLVTLAVTLLLVQAVMRGPVVVGVFLLGAVVGNVLTLVVFDEPGAGNSMATMVVAAAGAFLAARGIDAPAVRRYVPLVVLAALAVALVALGDHHGLAVAFGLLLGGAWSSARRRKDMRHRR